MTDLQSCLTEINGVLAKDRQYQMFKNMHSAVGDAVAQANAVSTVTGVKSSPPCIGVPAKDIDDALRQKNIIPQSKFNP